MGRIVCSVEVENAAGAEAGRLEFNALVDTGASFLTLPTAWKEKFGKLQTIREVELETATQATVKGEICGPVKIRIEGFKPIFGEILFVAMEPEDGIYEPLVGYIVLESSQIGVDMIGHRLVPIKHMDLK